MKQKLIEKLANKFKGYEVPGIGRQQMAEDAVNMFWPLVEAVKGEHLCRELHCDSPICYAMRNLEADDA